MGFWSLARNETREHMFLSLARGELMVRGGLLHVIAPPGEFGEKDLLGQACAHPFSRADRKFPDTSPARRLDMG